MFLDSCTWGTRDIALLHYSRMCKRYDTTHSISMLALQSRLAASAVEEWVRLKPLVPCSVQRFQRDALVCIDILYESLCVPKSTTISASQRKSNAPRET